MKTDAPAIRKEAQELIPWDLTEWVEPTVLMSWVWSEIESLQWENPELQEFLKKNPNYKPKELLALLTYSYATKTYESERICDDRAWPGVLLQTFSSLSPSRDTVIRFRRDNRGILRWALVQVFKRALEYRNNLPESDVIPAGLKQHLMQAAGERLDLARHLDRSVQP